MSELLWIESLNFYVYQRNLGVLLAYPNGPLSLIFWVKKFYIKAFYDLNILCLTFNKGPGRQFYTPLTEKLILREVIFFGQRTHFWGKKYRLSLLEGFRQISFYFPEQIRQISFYLPEEFRQISSYLPEEFRQITSSLKIYKVRAFQRKYLSFF